MSRLKYYEGLPPKKTKRKKLNIKEAIRVLEEVGKIIRKEMEYEEKNRRLSVV